LEQKIVDRTGEFDFMEDPNQYKKARKRMQNRESAVRSRMRKKFFSDDLEVRVYELEKINRELNEMNAGLNAENSLLKRQVAYFEDIFAKTSLLGCDSGSISKNDLEDFQKQLLRKINYQF